MSGMVEKVKAKVDGVLHKDKAQNDPTGPHNTHAANQADPRVDSDHVGSTGNYGSAAHGTHTGAHTGAHTGTTGTGMTGTHAGTTHTSSTDPSGPHDSHMANKADPRVDSDRYGAAGNVGSATHGTHTGTHTGMTGTHAGTGMTGAHTGTGMTGTHAGTNRSDPTGPHDSHLANKADPRVDSDRYGDAGNMGSATHGTTTHGGIGSTTHGTGMTGTHAGTGMTGAHTGTGMTGAHTGTGMTGTGMTGTGMTGTGMTGTGMTGTGMTGTGMTGTGMTGTHAGANRSDPTGPHDSHLANKADPRVDSDRYGAAGNMGSAAHGTHTGTHTGMTGTGMTGSHTGNMGTGNLAHRDNETGDLPKALVEPQSHAVPHSSTTGHHTTGTHGTTGVHGTQGTTGVHGTHGTTDVHGKPSMMDKLNPKKDADHDGKAGFMD